jgi:haloalkane dehalogenase
MPEPTHWRHLYPFTSHFLPLDGWRYHYLDEGSGDVFLMVHGNPTWSFYWRNLILGLGGQHRAVAPDHLGCGLSDKPADYPYSLRQHTFNLVRLIDHLALDRITLVGHDWGGAIGLGAALERPERFVRLVLLNTGAFPPPYVPRRIAVCRTPLLGRYALQGANLFARMALRWAVSQPQRLTPAVRAGVLAPYDRWSNRVGIYRFVRDIPLTRRHPTYADLCQLERRLPTLGSRPVQLIWGMQDWCFTAVCLERLMRIFPEAEVHRIEDAGHWVVEDAHERIVPLLETFVARHSTRPVVPGTTTLSPP